MKRARSGPTQPGTLDHRDGPPRVIHPRVARLSPPPLPASGGACASSSDSRTRARSPRRYPLRAAAPSAGG